MTLGKVLGCPERRPRPAFRCRLAGTQGSRPWSPRPWGPISTARAVVSIGSRAGIKAEQVLQKFPLKDSFSRFSFENKFITTSNRSPVAVGLITSSPGLSN